MNLSNLLDEPYINMEDVAKAISNREALKVGVKSPDLSFFLRFNSFEDAPIIQYYLGNIKSVSTLIPFSRTTFIPIFSGDVLQVKSRNKVENYKGQIFMNHILNGLSDHDDFIPDSHMLFKLSEIQEIKLLREDSKEVSETIEQIESINVVDEGQILINHTLFLINDEILRHNKASSLSDATGKLKWVGNLKRKSEIISIIENFLDDHNILTLVYLIKFLSHN